MITALLLAAVLLMPAMALAAWAWYVVSRVEVNLLAAAGFDGADFQIGPWSAAANGAGQGIRG